MLKVYDLSSLPCLCARLPAVGLSSPLWLKVLYTPTIMSYSLHRRRPSSIFYNLWFIVRNGATLVTYSFLTLTMRRDLVMVLHHLMGCLCHHWDCRCRSPVYKSTLSHNIRPTPDRYLTSQISASTSLHQVCELPLTPYTEKYQLLILKMNSQHFHTLARRSFFV